MDRSTFEALGDECKALEGRQSQTLLPYVPFLARLDGRAFHTFTRGLNKPYDQRFSALMWEVSRRLVKDFSVTLGYTQSDEITLYWEAGNSLFGGRVSKLESSLAGLASGVFNKLLPEYIPEKVEGMIPHFDCRCWAVPNWESAYKSFLWREEDATRNSLSMLCQALFTHKELQGKSRAAQHDMLHEIGRNWNDEPYWFKRGEYFSRVVTVHEFELDKLDFPGRPWDLLNTSYTRTTIEPLKLNPISTYTPSMIIDILNNLKETE